ncbi:hypothetical protein QFZ28_004436 [Neobacillus niacini]|jgi:hypothetical protein|uniref:hypothetical protein n=1 Tax=Neobacillus niacini TaxID=86668 RepID=UPI0027833799|nr:hypothetical protein [Neobacillus niacini]MDQ1004036.1 hypothetical protein [Neobacillus niacini]
MNKKLLAVIGISGTLMLGSVYSISANTSGYDLYKEALKKTHSADSATLEFNLNIEDNKKSILTSHSIFKSDSVNQLNSISTRLANELETSNMNLYKQDGNWYVIKEGLDTVYKMDTSTNPHHSNTAELKDDLENLIDVITKNLQQQITVAEKKDGNHLIELDLTGKEIPLSANALSTLMIKHAVMIQDNNKTESSDFHVKAQLPELDHEITVKQVKLTARVNKENYIQHQTVKVIVTGKDKQETSHELVLNIDLSATDYNSTTVTPVEIPAEKIVEFNHGRK